MPVTFLNKLLQKESVSFFQPRPAFRAFSCLCSLCGPDLWRARPYFAACWNLPSFPSNLRPTKFIIKWTTYLLPNVLRKIRVILDRIHIRKWIGPHAKINVQYITSCRDWKNWFLVIKISFDSIVFYCTTLCNQPPASSSTGPFSSTATLLQVGPRTSSDLPRRTEGRCHWTPRLHLSKEGRPAYLVMTLWLFLIVLQKLIICFAGQMFLEISSSSTMRRMGLWFHMRWILFALWRRMHQIHT